MRLTKIYVWLILTIIICVILFLATRVSSGVNFKETLYMVDNSLDVNNIDAVIITDELVKYRIEAKYIMLKASDDKGNHFIEVCDTEETKHYITFNTETKYIRIDSKL